MICGNAAKQKNHLQFKTHLDLFIWGFMGQNKDIFLENDVEIQFLEYLIAQNCTLLYPLLILFFWQTSKFLENSGVFVSGWSGPGVLLVVRYNVQTSPELSKQCVENFQLLHLHKKTRSKLSIHIHNIRHKLYSKLRNGNRHWNILYHT